MLLDPDVQEIGITQIPHPQYDFINLITIKKRLHIPNIRQDIVIENKYNYNEKDETTLAERTHALSIDRYSALDFTDNNVTTANNKKVAIKVWNNEENEDINKSLKKFTKVESKHNVRYSQQLPNTSVKSK